MSEQKKIQANKSQNQEHQLPEVLAKDHYLVQQEKEVWAKGTKISKPTLRLISINDFQSFERSNYFSKHEITIEILHDPSLPAAPAGTPPLAVTGSKKKADYVAEYAAILQIDIDAVDKSLTVDDLKQLIEEAKAGN